MVNQQLVNYIRTQQSQGYSPDQLRSYLIQQGYNPAEVNEALQYAAQQPGAKPIAGIKKRNAFLVLLFTFITVGIYGIYWIVSTTNELKRNTSSAPNPWLLILSLIPIVNIVIMFIYYWKYCKAIHELTGFGAGLLFALWIFLSPVAIVISQMELNKKATV